MDRTTCRWEGEAPAEQKSRPARGGSRAVFCRIASQTEILGEFRYDSVSCLNRCFSVLLSKDLLTLLKTVV